MDNENIKEILDKLNKNKNKIKDYCYYPDDVLSCDNLIKLLDYITNLQEELKSANDSITWWTNRFNAVERDNRKLQEEKEQLNSLVNSCQEEIRRLKELCDKYEEEHSSAFKEWQKAIKENEKLKEELRQEKKDFKETNDYCFELKNYKSRNGKAIEYILKLDKDYDINVYQEDKHWAMVLYILQGEDKDVKDKR